MGEDWGNRWRELSGRCVGWAESVGWGRERRVTWPKDGWSEVGLGCLEVASVGGRDLLWVVGGDARAGAAGGTRLNGVSVGDTENIGWMEWVGA